MTQRIRLGTMITPVSRMRPWKLASETATLDRLSNGRLILSVGLGALDSGFAAFGEVTDRQQRAELLDEGLELLTRLWLGRPVHFEAKHYRVEVDESNFLTPPPPPPVQQPRIPIWVVGAWPRQKSLQRALRYDGLLPNVMGADGKVRMSPATPDEVGEISAYIRAQRKETTPLDIILEGETPGDDPAEAAAIVRPYAEAGATWWIEARWTAPSMDAVLQRIRQGPPI